MSTKEPQYKPTCVAGVRCESESGFTFAICEKVLVLDFAQ